MNLHQNCKEDPQRVAALWGSSFARGVLLLVLAIVVKPLANVITKYICSDRYHKR